MTEVFTGEFFLIEGVNVETEEVHYIGVAFNELAVFEFVKTLLNENDLPYHLFRVTRCGNILAKEGVPSATHATSATKS